MPRPTSGTTIQRPDLGAISYEYLMAADRVGFIAQLVLPVFEVQHQSADYPVIPLEAIMKVPATKRASRGAYPRGDYEFETGTYACEEYGWEEPVDDAEARLYRRFFDAETVAVERATNILLRDYEKRVAAMVFNVSNITQTAAVATEWSTAATCTPRADVQAAIAALRAAMGIVPNSAVMCEKVFQNLLASKELRDYLQYTSPHLIETRMAQLDMVAKYLGVSQVLVAGGMYDTADKGQSASLADIWDDEYVLLARLAANVQDLREPCLGRTFLWTADSPQIVTTESYPEEQTRSNIYRVRQYVDEAFVYTGAGYLLSNITA
jgi:hypothetical protein